MKDSLKELEKAGKEAYQEVKNKIVDGIKQGTQKAIDTVKNKVLDQVQKVTGPIKDKINDVKDKGLNAIENAKNAVTNKITSLTNQLTNNAKNTAQNIAKGLGDAFASATSAPLSSAKNMVSSMLGDSMPSAAANDNDAFHGKVVINGKKYGIVECSYEFSQACDATGKPSARPRGGRLMFTMPSQSDDDVFFYRWMFDKTQVYDGYLKFVVWARQNKRCFKTVNFKNAYCVDLRDYFNDSDSKLMYTTITLAAEIIIVGANDTAEFNNNWTS